MAALGELVCGVAHEINTPLGVGITLASYVESKNSELNKILSNEALRLKDLQDYIESVDEASKSMIANLEKAAEIVTNFKNVAADQSTNEIMKFNIYDSTTEIISEYLQKYSSLNFSIELICDSDLEITSSPKALSHILHNLISNSIFHGFNYNSEGKIIIEIVKLSNKIQIKYRENGIGIPDEIKSKVFNPFFTTKRGLFPGLGLHIIHNMVTLVLKGDIKLISNKNEGLEYIIEFKAE